MNGFARALVDVRTRGVFRALGRHPNFHNCRKQDDTGGSDIVGRRYKTCDWVITAPPH
jgi:hypothetical protein